MILLEDVEGLGNKFDLINAPEHFVDIMSKRQALMWTPLTRKRYFSLVKENRTGQPL